MRCSSFVIAVSLFVFACAKDKAKDNAPPPTAGSGSATSGSGSAADSSGSAVGSGSGSAMAGSGSADGSGSAMAGSGSAEGSAAESGEAESEFDKLSHDDKVKFMKQKVMPAMKVAFQKFDPKEYASFTCKTCHGKDPAKAKYKMPTADLPVLDFAKIKAGKGGDPKVLEFMAKVVKPEMAKILGMPEMTETQKGFACLNCHTAKQ